MVVIVNVELVEVMVVVVDVVDVIVTVVVVVKTHLRLMVPVPVGTVPGNELQSA